MKTHNIISRKQAKELKLRRYYTGKPCINNHINERYVISGLCIECASAHNKKFINNNNARIKRKIYDEKNKESIRIKRKLYRMKNRKRLSKDAKEYYHKTKHRSENKLYQALRYGLSRIVSMIKENKQTRVLDSLPYSLDDLKIHIESLFKDGMSWENYGVCGWHIDHVKPLALIVNENKGKSQEDLHILVNALENLQPLWAVDNLLKGDKF